jgi:4-amino-4-deoxy-L-arabinose transferase-like glycosyltransferase
MVFVLLLTFALGSAGINADVIWYDELTSIGHAGGLTGLSSPHEVVESIVKRSPKHAPLFFELTAGWGNMVGWHHATIRILSLYFGVITIAWIYRIGKDFVNWRVGFWGALVLGTNVFWVEYYHEIRMYTLQIALIMMMMWHYLHLSSSAKPTRWCHWLGLIFSATASLYTQPFSFFAHVAIGIYHLFIVAKDRRWLNIALAFLSVGILFIPWLPVTYLGVSTKFDTGTSAMVLQEAVAVFVRLFSNGNWLILIVPLGIAVWQLRQRESRQQTKPIWILTILIIGLLLIINEAIGLIPLRRARYFFVSWGLLSLIIGIGLAWFRQWWIALLIWVVFMTSGFALRNAEDYQDYQGTVFAVNFYPPMHDYIIALKDKIRPHDYVVGFTEANFVNRRGKHGKSTGDYYMETLLGHDGTFIPSYFDDDELEPDVPEKLTNNPYLLLTYNPLEMPENFDSVLTIIEEDYEGCDIVVDDIDLFVQRYVHQSLECDREYEPIVFENGVTIVDKDVQYDASTDTVRILTGWEVANEQLLYEYNVSLQIVTGDWKNMGQTDRHLHDDLLKWYVADLPTQDLPAGDYRVMVIIYHRDTGEKVTGTDSITGETATILPITVFTIEE